MYPTFRELQGLDGVSIDFEWKIVPRSQSIGFSPEKNQADPQGKNITPEKISDRIIFEKNSMDRRKDDVHESRNVVKFF